MIDDHGPQIVDHITTIAQNDQADVDHTHSHAMHHQYGTSVQDIMHHAAPQYERSLHQKTSHTAQLRAISPQQSATYLLWDVADHTSAHTHTTTILQYLVTQLLRVTYHQLMNVLIHVLIYVVAQSSLFVSLIKDKNKRSDPFPRQNLDRKRALFAWRSHPKLHLAKHLSGHIRPSLIKDLWDDDIFVVFCEKQDILDHTHQQIVLDWSSVFFFCVSLQCLTVPRFLVQTNASSFLSETTNKKNEKISGLSCTASHTSSRQQ